MPLQKAEAFRFRSARASSGQSALYSGGFLGAEHSIRGNLSVRNSRAASAPRGHPSAPLLTGLPPRFFRHWRRSAPPSSTAKGLLAAFSLLRGNLSVRNIRPASGREALTRAPLLTGLSPRFFRHRQRSAPPSPRSGLLWAFCGGGSPVSKGVQGRPSGPTKHDYCKLRWRGLKPRLRGCKRNSSIKALVKTLSSTIP